MSEWQRATPWYSASRTAQKPLNDGQTVPERRAGRLRCGMPPERKHWSEVNVDGSKEYYNYSGNKDDAYGSAMQCRSQKTCCRLCPRLHRQRGTADKLRGAGGLLHQIHPVKA